MAKMRKPKKEDACDYALYPFGKGVALCSYKVVKEKKQTLDLKDFPPCLKTCYKEEDEKLNKTEETK